MSQAKHTSGPWVVDGDVIRGDHQRNGSISVASMLDVSYPYGRRAGESKHANAHLIAAAPELLEALIWMVANDETNEGDEPVESLGGESWNDYNKYWIDGLNRARAAIAKATGGE